MASPLPFVVLLLYLSLLLHAYSDLEAILKLKSSLRGSSASGLNDWAAPTSPSSPSPAHCSFPGLSCDADGRVTSIVLVDVPLSGTLPPEIGLLSKLVNLTLSGNNLTGSLPAEIRNLSSLKLLNLSRNVFGGTISGEMLAGLANLEVFDAYNNNFSSVLPVEFARLRKLRFLGLAGNYFSGVIPEVYSEFQSLTHLGLQGNSLTGKIPAGLAKIPNLAELYLGYYNTFSGGIPPEFGSMAHLQLLDLGMCNLSGEIPASLGNLKHLHSLFLQINNLTGQLSPELSGMTSLMSLDISMNDLTGKIPETFSDLKNLTLLNLFHNKFQGPVPSFLGDLPNLEVLHIWSNNFTLDLPENLGTNKRLMMLDVSGNRLTGFVPRNLCLGGKLKTLILMDNFFYGPLPDGIGSCGSLTRIRIKNNFLNGTVPDGIFRMSSLEILELDGNYFTGQLPEEIATGNLGRLSLSGNSLSGGIPMAVGNMTNLEILLLDENRFSGDIPDEIFGIEKLTKLDLSGNLLTGRIPAISTNGSLLSFIDLSRNELIGGISGNILRLQNLNVLNLSRNNLQGDIPVDIGLMKSLTVLDLSYNDFSGRVPLTGLLKDLDDCFFAGNPNLCLCHSSCCPSSSRGSGHESRARSRLAAIAIIITVTVLLALVGVSIFFKRHVEISRRWKLTAFQKLDFTAEDVVKCLRDENVIGRGGAGSVYLGSMPNGVDVAIKRLARRAGNDHGFMAEIRTMGNIRHRNIVKLLGYLCNKDTNMLLYEYMPNGSLGEVLHGPKGAHLRWESRFKVAVEAAKGLCYLHHDCWPPIIHRDVKSNNILLDSDYEAHVADFGLAKFLGDGGGSECMSSVAGSYGYIAPEYAYTLKINQKSDVYSFGVVLLELITGRKPVGGFGEGMDIVGWVMRTKSELSAGPADHALVLAVIDPRLVGYTLGSVVCLFRIAMMCVDSDSSKRPTMRGVVHMLENPHEMTCGDVG